jgi:hypothetical protein
LGLWHEGSQSGFNEEEAVMATVGVNWSGVYCDVPEDQVKYAENLIEEGGGVAAVIVALAVTGPLGGVVAALVGLYFIFEKDTIDNVDMSCGHRGVRLFLPWGAIAAGDPFLIVPVCPP